MKRFDIAPFALPNGPAGELKFEAARDVETVEVVFAGPAPKSATLQYMRKYWPGESIERNLKCDRQRPMWGGWFRMDDLFTSPWVDAATDVSRIDAHTLRFTFKPLRVEIAELPTTDNCDVTFRRTVALRIADGAASIRSMRVFTRSQPTRSTLRVELHAGKPTSATAIACSGYNAVIRRVTPGPGTRIADDGVHVGKGSKGSFEVEVDYMIPVHSYANDNAHVLFNMGKDAFTISLASLEAEGPIWFAEAGIYIAKAEDSDHFAEYGARIKGSRTVARQVVELREQSLAGAMNGQPRPHSIAYCCGAKHARQKFWIEPCGDIELAAWPLQKPTARDTAQWKNEGYARVLFGFDQWAVEGLHNDPWPVMAYNLQFRRNAVRVSQKCFAVPLRQSILNGEPAPDDTMVALVRFHFENTSDGPATAQLPISYSHKAWQVPNRRLAWDWLLARQTDTMIPMCEREKLTIQGDHLLGTYTGKQADLPFRALYRDDPPLGTCKEEQVLRLAFTSEMTVAPTPEGVCFRKTLQPGESCDFLARIPFVAIESKEDLAALHALDFDRCYAEMARYWRAESRKGAQIDTPVAHLNAVYTGHLPMVLMTDLGYPDGSGIVNTSAGACVYGNVTNESVMIIEELDQRGLVEEVRRRLAVWTKYQGTVGLKGRYTDHDGVFFGAGGLEQGDSYGQAHGWALWALARHFLHTGDRAWFASVVDSVIKGAEWIARQRAETIKDLPHSRGWERGFIPAGALEDVEDFFYWLSTNCLTWRGLDSAAAALEKFGHAEATRYRREADAFGRDLRRGFEEARRHSPLVRLRDGRWIPHYPSRLYCRGRDYGWIRETLEGSVYLLISGLYKAKSKQGGWILDDYHDNRYMNPPYSYPIEDPSTQWFDCGGFSPQPALLAGLLPHLDRDEIEVYLWMFFNAWASCYRAEVQAFVEHPFPVLGFGNPAPFKTSDQSNAMKWLAYMFVYEKDGLLHLGRAIPRAWFAQERPFSATRLSEPAGIVSVEYRPQPAAGKIQADVELEFRGKPEKVLLRFRHPEKKPILAVSVAGRPHRAFDAETGDVKLAAVSGKVRVEVCYRG